MNTGTVFVDLETTANGGPSGDDPEAHWHINKVLVWGHSHRSHVSTSKKGLHAALKAAEKEQRPMIVAHNAKFDLKYLMREFDDIRWELFDYFDTATMHYLWSGHRDKFPSFEYTCDEWEVTYTKTLKLADLLDQGIKMEQIPKDDLESYCIDDVKALIKLYYKMLDDDWVRKQEQTNWVAPLAEMELNGMKVDQSKCAKLLTDCAAKAYNAERKMQLLFKTYCGWSNNQPIDWAKTSVSAPRTVSACITGKPDRLTKHKTRTLELNKFPKMGKQEIEDVWGDVKATHLGYPMSEYYIERLLAIKHRLHPHVAEYVEQLVEYRKWNKLSSTYFGPFMDSAAIQGTVHPSMNTQATATGRLSSSNPNGQNMPEEAREVFCVSTHGWHMYEVDFKQLEIVAAAWWSEDPTLIQDLNSGADVHFNTGRTVMGWRQPSDMDENSRRIVKGVNFGLLFGGGPEGLSKSTGTDKSMVKSLIKGFFDRYPGVEDWHEEVYTAVCDGMQTHSIERGEQKYCSWFQEPSKLHRRWYFEEKPAPKWVKQRLGRSFSFKPTETKNYPVQGFAGADIVMQFVWRLWMMMRSLNIPIKLVMTVHDSLVIETTLDPKTLSTYLDKVCESVVHSFSIPVPLNYEIKGGGTHWR